MTTIAERISQVQLKVKRAKEHVEETEREVRRFLDTHPYGVGCKNDPQTGKLLYYVASVRSTPVCLPLIAGDAIQCLVSALDHLAYQLVCSDTGGNPPTPSRIYFPIGDSSQEYEARKGGKMKGAAQETFDAIDALKPYKGGNDALLALLKLNNIEKHRLLLTVGSHVAGTDLAQNSVPEHLEYWAKKLPPDQFDAMSRLLKSMHVFFTSDDKGFPLKEGDVLLIGGTGDKANPDMQFRFEVALAEPGIFESKSLVESLHQFTTLVEGIVVALTPRLRDTT